MEEQYQKTIRELKPLIVKLNKTAMENTATFVEGNYMYDSGALPLDGSHIKHSNKQINLIQACSGAKHIVEVGLNAAHSAALMLTANPRAKYTFFDIAEHKYVLPCFSILRQEFKDTHMVLIIGDSTVELPQYFKRNGLKFDFCHVDGGHSIELASKDMENVYTFAQDECVVVLDDTEYKHLSDLFESYVKDGKIVESECLSDNHRIGRFVKEPNINKTISNPSNEKPKIHLTNEKPKIHLITQYYDTGNMKRQNEINECLLRNVANSEIDVIHLLCDNCSDIPFGLLSSSKIRITNLGKRLTWKDVLHYIKDVINTNDTCIVSNSDIYFTKDGLSKVRSIHPLQGIVLALLRYDMKDDGNMELFGTNKSSACYHKNVIHGASQDSWIFNANVASILLFRDDLDFYVGGEKLCDSKINWIFHTSGLKILNPSYEIMTVHLHSSMSRTYGESTLKGPFIVVPPSTLTLGIPVIENTVILTYTTKGYVKYTINLYRSLKRINRSESFIAVCPDIDTKKILEKEGIKALWFHPFTPVDCSSSQISFGTEKFSAIAVEKLRVIHHFLSYGNHVIFTDSDVVWFKDCVNELINELEGYDIAFQDDIPSDKSNNNACTGFIVVKPSEHTIKLFDPRFSFDVSDFNNDQKYLNYRIGRYPSKNATVNVTYKLLDKYKYLNGSLFLNDPSLAKNSYITHFNWIRNNEKWETMKKYGMILKS